MLVKLGKEHYYMKRKAVLGIAIITVVSMLIACGGTKEEVKTDATIARERLIVNIAIEAATSYGYNKIGYYPTGSVDIYAVLMNPKADNSNVESNFVQYVSNRISKCCSIEGEVYPDGEMTGIGPKFGSEAELLIICGKK